MSLQDDIRGADLDAAYEDFGLTWTHIEQSDSAQSNTKDVQGIFSIIGIDPAEQMNTDLTVAELRIRTSEFRSIAIPRLCRASDSFLGPVDPTNGNRTRYRVAEIPQDDGFGEIVMSLMKMTHKKVSRN